MNRRAFMSAGLMTLGFVAFGGLAAPFAEAAPAPVPGKVYLFRGLANIFSLGMDKLGDELKAAGIASELHNHLDWPNVVADIVADQKAGKKIGPIAISGHSFGADAALRAANALSDAGIPVALVVTFDPTVEYSPRNNVKRVINFSTGARVIRLPDYLGKLENRFLNQRTDVSHFNVEKMEDLHVQTVAAVKKAFSVR